MEKTLDERFDEHFKKRDRINNKFFKESDKLNDEFDALMEELENS